MDPIMITPVLVLTLLCAIALGWVGHALFGKKKRKRIPNGSALQQQPDPVWAKWAPEIGRAISGRKEL